MKVVSLNLYIFMSRSALTQSRLDQRLLTARSCKMTHFPDLRKEKDSNSNLEHIVVPLSQVSPDDPPTLPSPTWEPPEHLKSQVYPEIVSVPSTYNNDEPRTHKNDEEAGGNYLDRGDTESNENCLTNSNKCIEDPEVYKNVGTINEAKCFKRSGINSSKMKSMLKAMKVSGCYRCTNSAMEHNKSCKTVRGNFQFTI